MLHLTPVVLGGRRSLLCNDGNKHNSSPSGTDDIEMQKPSLWDADVLQGDTDVNLISDCRSPDFNSLFSIPRACQALPLALFATAFLCMPSKALQTCICALHGETTSARSCSGDNCRSCVPLPEGLRHRHREQRNQRCCCCQGPVRVQQQPDGCRNIFAEHQSSDENGSNRGPAFRVRLTDGGRRLRAVLRVYSGAGTYQCRVHSLLNMRNAIDIRCATDCYVSWFELHASVNSRQQR